MSANVFDQQIGRTFIIYVENAISAIPKSQERPMTAKPYIYYVDVWIYIYIYIYKMHSN